MGYNSHNSAAFLIALILFSSANPLAHAILPILSPILGPFLPGLFPPRPVLPPITIPPVTLPPPITIPPVTIPPVTLPPPITIPPVTPLSPSLIPPVPPLAILPNLTLVTGSLCCTPSGTCPGTPLPGVLVRVNCTSSLGVNVLAGQNTTDINGTFIISIPRILGVVPSNLSAFPCLVTARLPLNETLCPVLSTLDVVLVGIVGLITTLVDQVLGVLQRITIAVFFGIRL